MKSDFGRSTARAATVRALSDLPDRGRLLCKPFFAVTGPDADQGSNPDDVIHFGWQMKDGFDLLPEYLADFMSLLHLLHWIEARVHIHSLYGTYDFSWEACDAMPSTDGSTALDWPVGSWTFDDCGNWPDMWLECERARLLPPR